MTTPNVWDTYRTQGIPVTPQDDPWATYRGKADTPAINRPTSFLDRLKVINSNVDNLFAAGMGAIDVPNTLAIGNITKGTQLYQQIIKANQDPSQAMSIAMDKLSHIGDFVKNDIWGGIKSGASALVQNPVDFISGMPSQLLTMATQPLSAVLGVELDKVAPQAMTPEERANAIKATAALAVQTLVTAGSAKMVSNLGKVKIASEALSTPQLADVTSATKIGAFAQEFTKGAIAGGMGGLAYGITEGSSEPDQFAKAVSSSLMFASLGGFIHSIQNTGKSYIAGVKNEKLATDIVNYRQLQMRYEDSLKDLDTKAQNIIGADDLADAVLGSKISMNPGQPVIVQGLSTKKMSAARLDKLGYDVHLRPSGEGVSDALLVPKLNPPDISQHINTAAQTDWMLSNPEKLWTDLTKAEQIKIIAQRIKNGPSAEVLADRANIASTFQKSGFVPNEIVSYNGKNYTLKAADMNGAAIENSANGEITTAPLGQIRRVDGVIRTAQPAEVLASQYQDFKSSLIKRQSVDKVSSLLPDNQLAVDLSKLPALKRIVFQKNLATEILNEALSPGERGMWEAYTQATKPKFGTFEEFSNYAANNGYRIEMEDAGRVIIRDYGDPQHKVVGYGNNLREARAFIDASGQAKGEEMVPGNVSGLASAAFDWRSQQPEIRRPQSLPVQMVKTFLIQMRALSMPIDWMKDFDQKYGTKFAVNIGDQLAVARSKYKANVEPYLNNLQKNILNVMDNLKLSPERREVIFGHVESASPEELLQNGGPGGRALLPHEIDHVHQLTNNESIAKAFRYRAAQRGIESNNDLSDAEKTTRKLSLSQDLGMSPQDQKYSDIISSILDQPKKETDLSGIIRTARAFNAKKAGNGGYTQEEYAKLNNMSAAELNVSSRVSAMFDDLGSQFGVKNRLMSYITHARLYSPGDMSASLDMFARAENPAAQKFYASLSRTGELDTFERDPGKALGRYITSGFRAQYYAEAEKLAKTHLEQTIRGSQEFANLYPDQPMPRGLVPVDQLRNVKQTLENTIADMGGRVPPEAQATNTAVDRILSPLLDKMGIRTTRDVIVGMQKINYTSSQGFRIRAGERDFVNSGIRANVWFGPERAAKILSMGVQATLDGSKLISSGELPGLDMPSMIDPTYEDSPVLAKGKAKIVAGFDKFSKAGLAASGQKVAYDLWRQGAYHETIQRVAAASRDLQAKKIDIDGFMKQIEASKLYSDPIKAEINRQLTQVSPIRYEDIARLAARESARLLSPEWGPSSSPFGWSGNAGRMLGMYGRYSVFEMNMMKNMLTTGTAGERLARVARAAISEGAVRAVSEVTGLNLSPWYIHTAGLKAGPIPSTVLDAYNAIAGTDYEKKDAQAKLRQNMLGWPNLWIPGSFAANDVYQTMSGQNPLALIASPMGR